MNISSFTAALFVILTSTQLHAQLHGHIDGGVIDANGNGAGPGDQLAFFSNEIPNFTSGGGFAVQMNFDNNPSSRYRGTYSGSQTFTVYSAESDEPEDSRHPALNSYIQLRIVSVSGPTGGRFSFWESTARGGGSSPSVTLQVGTTDGAFMFPLTESTAGGDPYGHIHGRRFTADTPGKYIVGFRLIDTSSAFNGGPIHTASAIQYIDFMAVPEPSSAVLLLSGMAVLGRRSRRAN
jgi:hypothetical protein